MTIQAGTARRTGLQVAAFRYLQAYAQVSKGPVRVLAKLKEVYPNQHVVSGPRYARALCSTAVLPADS